jgi:hypothetical protein
MRSFFVFQQFRSEEPSNEGGGGSSPAPETVTVPIEQLKAWGFETVEQMNEYLTKVAESRNEPTEEEKARLRQIEEVNFHKYLVEEGLMTTEEIDSFKSVSAKADADLVFEDFRKQYLEEIGEEEVDESTIREAFENAYHINSENATLRARGQRALEKEAAELRKPLVEKYQQAQSRFKDYETHKSLVPKWNSHVDELLSAVVSGKMKVFEKKIGDKEVAIEIELTADDIAELAQKFKMNERYYLMFKEGKTKELDEILLKKAQAYVKQQRQDQILNEVWQKAESAGRLTSSYVGAKAPFLINQSQRKVANEQLAASIIERQKNPIRVNS